MGKEVLDQNRRTYDFELKDKRSNKFELLHNNDQETVSSVKIGLTDSDKTQGRIKIQYNLLRDLIVGELEIIEHRLSIYCKNFIKYQFGKHLHSQHLNQEASTIWKAKCAMLNSAI